MLSAAADRAGWWRVKAGRFARRCSLRPTETKVGLEAAAYEAPRLADATGTLTVVDTGSVTFQQTFAAGRREVRVVAVGQITSPPAARRGPSLAARSGYVRELRDVRNTDGSFCMRACAIGGEAVGNARQGSGGIEEAIDTRTTRGSGRSHQSNSRLPT